MRILFLSRWYPYPADNGSKIRIYNLIRQLAARHPVDVISFYTEPVDDWQIEGLKEYCGQVSVAPYRPFRPNRKDAILGYFSPQPRSLVDTHSEEIARLASEAGKSGAYDVAIASEIDMIQYILGLPVRVKIFEEIEVTTLYEQFFYQKQPLKRLRSGLTWKKLSRYLRNTLPRFDGVTVVSEQELERIREILPDYRSIEVIPNGVDTGYLSGDFGQPEAGTLIYNGALTYGPNFDAMAYFLEEIFPLIRAQRPDACLYITGKTEGVPLKALPQSDGVVFTGYLPDIRPRVAKSWVSVAPLRHGGGTRLKVLESMALGTPVVATTKGAEGLNLRAGEDILIADSPVGFASAVLRVLGDAGLRGQLSRAGRKKASAEYSWDTIGEKFIGFVEQAAGGGAYGSHG